MQTEIFVGQNKLQNLSSEPVQGNYVSLFGNDFYCIRNYDQMPPFFMSIVSSSDHWIFISSTGGLTAGRTNAESALFPYYTDDKITENYQNTGSISVLQVKRNQKTYLWEPFTPRYFNIYKIERNLYKHVFGNQLMFEEINHDLQITFRTLWQTSEKFGFAKTSWAINTSDSPCSVNLVDGLQNILPYGATTALQTTFSNLLNAYKRNELDPQTGLGIFALSSTLSDLAEPSESLKATTVWQTGLDHPTYLLSTSQLNAFRVGKDITPEIDVRGQRGAYLVNTNSELLPFSELKWTMVAEVNQDGTSVANLKKRLEQESTSLVTDLITDIDQCTADLRRIVANADGLQISSDRQSSVHHFSNVLFNTMRGGIFADNYTLDKNDLLDFINVRNKSVLHQYATFFSALPKEISYNDLISGAEAANTSGDLLRLCYEYLPLTFSRRHGDPSRPWNKFSINLKKPDGSKRLEYQGNWRDIFQNWEPLAWSFPEFTESMICKFLNATTADGYNPYRITRDGIEWESPAPGDPWANIGYWGDHQIVYLLNLLEISRQFHPDQITNLLRKPIFSIANIPYRIKPYSHMLKDPFATIAFDWELEQVIEKRVEKLGTDGKLILTKNETVFHVNMLEKLLSLFLSKMANFIPDGGIWMNTQRPEWNDANNALVGKGLSVVTTGYLRRFTVFFIQLLTQDNSSTYRLTEDITNHFFQIFIILKTHETTLRDNTLFTNLQRREFMDALGNAGSDYRSAIYAKGLSGDYIEVERENLLIFSRLALKYIEQTLQANRRPDNLFHAYNILQISAETAGVGYLDEMLEGQVSILASGFLSNAEAATLLKSLRNSRLYRANQHSYILYPDRNLPGFLQKNLVDASQIKWSTLIPTLVQLNNISLISSDSSGAYHFNGSFRNAGDVRKALANLRTFENLKEMVDQETESILALFEKQFNHNAFTGRSGTFFAYEGLGSIYWHMVSKLLLTTQENYLKAIRSGASDEIASTIKAAYQDIRSGLGFNKSPDEYGAFPTDPYSHSPADQGAKQPGMTGQVKEEILTRLREMGIFVENGLIVFNPILIRRKELITQASQFNYINVNGQPKIIDLPSDSCACTFCQVPIVIKAGERQFITLHWDDGHTEEIEGCILDQIISHHIFRRDKVIQQITFVTNIP